MSAISSERLAAMKKIQELIQNEYQFFKSWYYQQAVFTINGEFPFRLLENRICGEKQRSLKAYFAYSIYTFLAIQNSRFITQKNKLLFEQRIPFVAEVLMTIQYYDNQILDKKGGVTDHESIVNNLKLSALLRSVLYDYINDEAIFEKNIGIIINKWSTRILKQVDQGQLLEKKNNLYGNFNSGLFSINYDHSNDQIFDKCLNSAKEIILASAPELKNHDHFLNEYIKRVYLAGASMYPSLVQMITEILDYKENNKLDVLFFFSGMLGITLQTVNDTVDNVPSCATQITVAKKHGDAFSDIKNGNITLPILLHLQNSKTDLIEGLIVNQIFDISLGLEKAIFRELDDSGAIVLSKAITKKLADFTKNIINEIESPSVVDFLNKQLKDINNIADYNKSYGYIDKTIKSRVKRLEKLLNTKKKRSFKCAFKYLMNNGELVRLDTSSSNKENFHIIEKEKQPVLNVVHQQNNYCHKAKAS